MKTLINLIFILLFININGSFAQKSGHIDQDTVFLYIDVDLLPKLTVNDYGTIDNYIHSNLRFPIIFNESAISGVVYASFVVTKDGNIERIRILNSFEEHLDNEVIRVLQSMPKWIPGIKNDKAVHTRLILPFVFLLR